MPGTLARRWTAADLDRMVEVGIVREGTGAFLWDGEIKEPIPEDQPRDVFRNVDIEQALRVSGGPLLSRSA